MEVQVLSRAPSKNTLWGVFTWCLYFTKLAPIFKIAGKPTRHARGNSRSKPTLGERPATRLGLPRRTPKKMFLTISDLARGRIFLKRTGHFFGVSPSRSRAVAGLKMDFGKVKTVFWGVDFTLPQLISDFPPAGGVWGGMRAGFSFFLAG